MCLEKYSSILTHLYNGGDRRIKFKSAIIIKIYNIKNVTLDIFYSILWPLVLTLNTVYIQRKKTFTGAWVSMMCHHVDVTLFLVSFLYSVVTYTTSHRHFFTKCIVRGSQYSRELVKKVTDFISLEYFILI